MAEHIFQMLVRLIRDIGEETKCCDINKISLVESPYVAGIEFSLDNISCSLHHVLCKVIGASCRDVPQRNPFLTFHKPAYDLIQRSVSSAAYHQIHLRRKFFGFLMSVTDSLGGMSNDFIASLHKRVDDFIQLVFDLSFSGFGIEDK